MCTEARKEAQTNGTGHKDPEGEALLKPEAGMASVGHSRNGLRKSGT